MFDFLTSTKRPASGTPVLSVQQVIERLKALNRPTAPWGVIDGRSEGVDLIAEWKIVDASSFKGQTKSIEFGAAYDFTEDLTIGQQYKYRFETGEIKKPVQEAVTACGWIYKGVAFGKL